MFEIILAALRPSASYSVQRAEVPTDPASLFIYVLLLVSACLIWYGNRNAGRPRRGGPGAYDELRYTPPLRLRPPKPKKAKARRKKNPGHQDWLW